MLEMRYTAKIGSYFGIPVRIHLTFPLILIVFGGEAWLRGTWQEGVWAVLLVTAIFVCVVLHEFGHSLQARRYGITVRDIVLLPIGGMARAESIPEKPRQEIAVAISGPIVNFFLAAVLLGVLFFQGEPVDYENNFIADLFIINIVLGTFNLIPAYPMDGGRILRGILASRMHYLRATRYAKNIGQIIAILFVVAAFVNGRLVMLPLIAFFIFFGAINEERAIKIKFILRDKILGDFLPEIMIRLDAGLTIGEAAFSLQSTNLRVFPVTDGAGNLLGAVLRGDIEKELNTAHSDKPLRDILRMNVPLLSAETPAIQAYHFLKSKGHRLTGVARDGTFAGFVSLDDFGVSV
jgi:stage IV sporulation protein FB